MNNQKRKAPLLASVGRSAQPWLIYTPVLMFQTNPETYLQLFGIQRLSDDAVIIVCVCSHKNT